MAMENTKLCKEHISAASNVVDTKLAEIKETYLNSGFGFDTIAESGFNKSNMINDLTKNVKGISPIPDSEDELFPSLGIVNGYNTISNIDPTKFGKPGVKYSMVDIPYTRFNVINSYIDKSTSILDTNETARMAWIEIEPNTTYNVTKLNQSGIYGLTDTEPAIGVKVDRFVSSDFGGTNSDTTLTTRETDKYLLIAIVPSTGGTYSEEEMLASLKVRKLGGNCNVETTVIEDREDVQPKKRWTTRTIFKFTNEQYGYDRCLYIIPLADLANGIVINGGENGNPHDTTLSVYPYPEEIIMTSEKSEKNFIHFINVQYTDSHYGHFNGRDYNLMIVNDRTRFGVENEDGNGFLNYTSVYANDIETELAFIKNGNLYIPVPDAAYGEELINTLWDCRVIWRQDEPDREFTITADIESAPVPIEEEYYAEINDFSIHDDRVCLYRANCNISYITKNRNSITEFTELSHHVCANGGSALLVDDIDETVAVSPAFINSYEPSQNIGLSKNPNQIFKISNDDCYIGFRYYETKGRGNFEPYQSEMLANRSNILCWGLFGADFEVLDYDVCAEEFCTCPYNITLEADDKIVKIYRDSINYYSGISTFYIITLNKLYKLTFDISDLENPKCAIDYATVFSENISPIIINRISSTEFIVVEANGKIYKLDTNGDATELLTSIYSTDQYACILTGKHLIAEIQPDRITQQIFYDSSFGNNEVYDANIYELPKLCNTSGKYGLVLSDGKYVCKLLERFTFDKELLSIPSEWKSQVTTIDYEDAMNRGICYGNGKYVMTSYELLYYSYDAIHWICAGEGPGIPCKNLSYCNGTFIVYGDGEEYAYSVDGITWTVVHPNMWIKFHSSIIYYRDRYILVSGSSIFYSLDCIEWVETFNSDSYEQTWTSVCCSNDKLVAVGDNGSIIAYSTDGIEWTECEMGLMSNSWYDICYANGKFVVVGHYNACAFSEDGITWAENYFEYSGQLCNWTSVCYGEGKFVAIGKISKYEAEFNPESYKNPPILYSLDGINWHSTIADYMGIRSSFYIEHGSENDGYDTYSRICYGNDKFVATLETNEVIILTEL